MNELLELTLSYDTKEVKDKRLDDRIDIANKLLGAVEDILEETKDKRLYDRVSVANNLLGVAEDITENYGVFDGADIGPVVYACRVALELGDVGYTSDYENNWLVEKAKNVVATFNKNAEDRGTHISRIPLYKTIKTDHGFRNELAGNITEFAVLNVEKKRVDLIEKKLESNYAVN